MTQKALEKLNEKQMTYCKTISALIARARDNGLMEEFEKNGGKLRGFLECLCQMEIITGMELKDLYLWFFAKDRNQMEEKETENPTKGDNTMIEFEVNNQRKIQMEQAEPDGAVTVTAWEAEQNGIREVDYEYEISPEDFVMMLNWYIYQKENGNPNLNF